MELQAYCLENLVKIYNDLDSQVVNFLRILRDPVHSNLLSEAISLNPFSRDEFSLSFETVEDPIESARQFVVRCALGYGSGSMDLLMPMDFEVAMCVLKRATRVNGPGSPKR